MRYISSLTRTLFKLVFVFLLGLLAAQWAVFTGNKATAQVSTTAQDAIYLPLTIRGSGSTSTGAPTVTPGTFPTPGPVVTPVTIQTPSDPSDWLTYVNQYRAIAGSPPVTEDATLNANCFEHARYIAENKALTHEQDPKKPFASAAGQICAQKGDVWIGTGTAWEPVDTVNSWVESVGHRLWLLYPTTPTFGYGFYEAASNTGAALDVLSKANFNADTSNTGWPIRYPVANQVGIPATAYPITLNWRYFGAQPTVTSTSLTTAAGTPIDYTVITTLPAGHKGIELLPSAALPNNTAFIVTIAGVYDGVPFNTTWKFGTGQVSIP